MPAPAPPLSVLLSHALVAYAIEFDNEFERRLHKTWARPFLTSIVVWSNVMRFVPEDGIAVGDLATTTCAAPGPLASLVGGLERWGYLRVERDGKGGFGTARGVGPAASVVPSITGSLTQQLWQPLGGEIEQRWRERLGGACVNDLVAALVTVHDRLEVVMPRFLPVVSTKGLFAAAAVELRESETGAESEVDLPTLLSRVLLGMTLDYERDSPVSLPIAANVLPVLRTEPMPVGELPIAAGVSKDAVSVSLTWLERSGLVRVGPAPSARGKVASLTDAGLDAQAAHARRASEVEDGWETRFGASVIESLRRRLDDVLAHPDFAAALVAPDGGWRASGRYKASTAAFAANPREALPQHPMVLHRGGWPDGS